MSFKESSFEQSRWLKVNKIDLTLFTDKFWVKKSDSESSGDAAWIKAYQYENVYIPVEDDPYSIYPLEASSSFDGLPNIIPVISLDLLENLFPVSVQIQIQNNYSNGSYIVTIAINPPFELEMDSAFEVIKWLNNYFKKDLKNKLEIEKNKLVASSVVLRETVF